MWYDRVLCSGSHKAEVKVSAGAGSSVLFQIHLTVGSILFLVAHLTEVLIFLLAVDWEYVRHHQVLFYSLLHGPPIQFHPLVSGKVQLLLGLI